MKMRHRIGLGALSLVAVGVTWLWLNPASATPTIKSVTSAADYKSVTVVFQEGVSGSGTGAADGKIVAGDVVIGAGAGATLSTVTHTAGGDTVVLGFSGAIQTDTSITITIDDTSV